MKIVCKFGGTSVGDLQRIENVAQKVSQISKEGNEVVVVVSAMSGVTNKLIADAQYMSEEPKKREMDMLLSSGEQITSSLLAIKLEQMRHKSIAMTGRDAGILTDNNYTKAKISSINPNRINDQLGLGKIIVVAGFQGISDSGNITTLGRGGSDLTAIAIAGAIKANLCEIYTDVDGVYTTDPRIVNKAKKIKVISYDEMLELAASGAKVLQTRSVEMAKKMNVKVITRSSFSNNQGTLITAEENIMEKPLVSGIALDKNQARVSIIGVLDKPGIASEIFNALAETSINVDIIVQTTGQDGKTNIDFTVVQNELQAAKKTIETFIKKADIEKINIDENICKVSIVGIGMKTHSGVAAQAFKTLACENINLLMITTSEIKLSMVIAQAHADTSVRILHDAFELEK